MEFPLLWLDDLDIKVKLGKSLFNILYLRLDPHISYVSAHCHQSYELHYIPYGFGTLIANGEKYDITPGTLYMTGPGIVHEQFGSETDSMGEYCIFFEMVSKNKSSLEKMNNDLDLISSKLKDVSFWFGKDAYNCGEIYTNIANEVINSHLGYQYIIKNYITQILINTVRNYEDEKASKASFGKKTLDDKRLLIIEYSMANLYSTITEKLLSDKLGLSLRQTNRVFKEYYNKSFKEKLIEKRMEMAGELLLNSTKSIQEISVDVGYSGLDSFRNNFEKFYNCSPSNYRKRCHI